MKTILDKINLFRGFHVDALGGDTTIVVNGERLRGTWVFGSLLQQNHPFDDHIDCKIVYFDGGNVCYDSVIYETAGKWVRPDMDGKDIFVGDRLVDLCGDICTVVVNTDTFEYGVVHDLFPNRFKNFHSIQSYTKVGNIFEVK